MASCEHQWGQPYNEMGTIRESYTDGVEAHGSDIWPVIKYRNKTISVWVRECQLCGKKEYTHKTKPIITGYEPDF